MDIKINEKNAKKWIIRIVTQAAIIGVTVVITALVTKSILLPDEPAVEIQTALVVEAEEDETPVQEPESAYATFDELYEAGLPEIFDEKENELALRRFLRLHPEGARVFERAEEYPEELLLGLCKNEDLLEFCLAYPDAPRRATGGFTKAELKEEHPLFLQFDPRWGFSPYGDDGMIASSGCAPTALSMVVVDLLDDPDATPDAIADYCMDNGLYASGAGTDWSLFTTHSKEFGVKGTRIDISEENMKSELDKGHPIILSVGPGDFTQNGHLIVIVDYKDGKFVVRDPGSRARSEKLWSFERIAPQVKNLWAFSKM